MENKTSSFLAWLSENWMIQNLPLESIIYGITMTVKKRVCFAVVVVFDDFFLSLLKCPYNSPEVNNRTRPQESQKPFAPLPNLAHPAWQFSEPRGCQRLGKHSAEFKAEIFLGSRAPVGKLNYINKNVVVTAPSPLNGLNIPPSVCFVSREILEALFLSSYLKGPLGSLHTHARQVMGQISSAL